MGDRRSSALHLCLLTHLPAESNRRRRSLHLTSNDQPVSWSTTPRQGEGWPVRGGRTRTAADRPPPRFSMSRRGVRRSPEVGDRRCREAPTILSYELRLHSGLNLRAISSIADRVHLATASLNTLPASFFPARTGVGVRCVPTISRKARRPSTHLVGPGRVLLYTMRKPPHLGHRSSDLSSTEISFHERQKDIATRDPSATARPRKIAACTIRFISPAAYHATALSTSAGH
jgi:hypothetical protein